MFHFAPVLQFTPISPKQNTCTQRDRFPNVGIDILVTGLAIDAELLYIPIHDAGVGINY